MANPNQAIPPASPDQTGPRRARNRSGNNGNPAPNTLNQNPLTGDINELHADWSGPPRVVGRRYHLYSPSVFYIIITIFIGIGAFNAQNNLLFFVFGVTLATLIVSGIVSGTMMMGVTVRRVIEGPSEVGKPVRLTYRVTNMNRRFPLFALRITEWPDRSAQRGRKAKRARRGRDAPADDHPHGRLGPTSAFATFVPGGGSITVPADASPLRAGLAELRGFEVSTVFPFGIARKSVRFAQRARMTIRQPTVPLSGQTLAALEASGRAQRHAAQAGRGQGEEFFGIREYSPGDPMRLIAWRASARSGDLRTRVLATPPRAAVRLVLDLEGLDDTPEELTAESTPPKQRDPLGRALSWPLRVMGFLDDEPGERPPMLSPMDRALALAGSLAAELLARGFAVEVTEQSGKFTIPLGSGARQRELILTALALRHTKGDDAARIPSSFNRLRDSSAMTVRLMSAREDAAPPNGAPATNSMSISHSGPIALTYEQLAAAITAPEPIEPHHPNTPAAPATPPERTPSRMPEGAAT